MKKKTDNKKRNIAEEIYFEIHNDITLDMGYHGKEIDITATSANLDIHFTTEQTHFENIYFTITIYDYNNKTEIPAGYIYLKHNNGMIDSAALQTLLKAIEAGNNITTNIFKELY